MGRTSHSGTHSTCTCPIYMPSSLATVSPSNVLARVASELMRAMETTVMSGACASPLRMSYSASPNTLGTCFIAACRVLTLMNNTYQLWRLRPGLVGSRHPQRRLLVPRPERSPAVVDQVRERDGQCECHTRCVVPVRSLSPVGRPKTRPF